MLEKEISLRAVRRSPHRNARRQGRTPRPSPTPTPRMTSLNALGARKRTTSRSRARTNSRRADALSPRRERTLRRGERRIGAAWLRVRRGAQRRPDPSRCSPDCRRTPRIPADRKRRTHAAPDSRGIGGAHDWYVAPSSGICCSRASVSMKLTRLRAAGVIARSDISRRSCRTHRRDESQALQPKIEANERRRSADTRPPSTRCRAHRSTRCVRRR